jgi:tRNA (guanine37-N1)-methyltransferase
MLMKPDVLYAAWESVVRNQSDLEPNRKTLTVLLSPQGVLFEQKMAQELTGFSTLILICGHYEGVDQRFIDLCVDREISIGDYVLTGGELPALVLADTVTRLIPGVVGNRQSLMNDSLENGLLKYPQFTRPREFLGHSVPPVLLEGDHEAIRLWRQKEMRTKTQSKRPDLWNKLIEEDE